MNRSSLLLALVLLVAPDSGLACILPPPAPQLPNETAEAYRERARAALEANEFELRRTMQARLLDQAARVSIGIIVSSEAEQAFPGARRIVVRPVKVLKGTLSTETVALADQSLTDCGPIGGGSATQGAVGEYVILFEGSALPGGEPSFGILAREASEPRLLQALFDYAVQSGKAQAVH